MLLFVLLMVLVLLVLAFNAINIVHFRKLQQLSLLLPYGLFALAIVVIIVYLNINFSLVMTGDVLPLYLNLFQIIEFVSFIIYIKKQLKGDIARRVMLFSLQLFPLVTGYYWLYNDISAQPPAYLSAVHFLLIAGGCMLFYNELFADPPEASLKRHPAFWTANGIFLYSALSITFPVYIGQADLPPFVQLLVLHMKLFAYSILFTFFLIATKCQTNIR